MGRFAPGHLGELTSVVPFELVDAVLEETTVKVRVIDAQIAVTCADGTSFTEFYRLVTTLIDARRYPATVLVGLYHQRWEHESAYYALRHTIMNGRNLRSGDPAGIEQEMWSLLTPYQALRTVMVDAAESVPGTDPDRCCFNSALQTARYQVIQATGIITADTDRDTRPRDDRPPDPDWPAPSPAATGQHPQGQVTDVPLQRAPRRRPARYQPHRYPPRRHRPRTR
ncbi:hypothetical protein [Streptomyces sp. NPDC088400]|uniref:hypothetical protein n=1 Tax=Streptomyces sp. NPDC088400 TaxID=3365861 RepID=UPI00382B8E82